MSSVQSVTVPFTTDPRRMPAQFQKAPVKYAISDPYTSFWTPVDQLCAVSYQEKLHSFLGIHFTLLWRPVKHLFFLFFNEEPIDKLKSQDVVRNALIKE